MHMRSVKNKSQRCFFFFDEDDDGGEKKKQGVIESESKEGFFPESVAFFGQCLPSQSLSTVHFSLQKPFITYAVY